MHRLHISWFGIWSTRMMENNKIPAGQAKNFTCFLELRSLYDVLWVPNCLMLVVEEECWKGAMELVRSVWKVQHKGISHQEGVNAPFLWYLPLNSLQKWSYPLTWKCEHTIPMVSSIKFPLSLSLGYLSLSSVWKGVLMAWFFHF